MGPDGAERPADGLVVKGGEGKTYGIGKDRKRTGPDTHIMRANKM